MAEWGRETIQIFEVDQPLCTRIYGDGVGLLTVDAAEFDGSEYFSRGAGLTGAADGKTGVFSGWFYLTSGGGVQYLLCEGVFGGVRFEIFRFSSPRYFVVRGRNSAGTEILIAVTTNVDYIAGTGPWHLLVSWDLANAKCHIYVNDVDVFDSFTATLTDDSIDHTVPDVQVGAATENGNAKFEGEMSEFYFAPNQYLDFSVEANRRKFISANGFPVGLGSDGSTPTGIAPLIYFHLNDNQETPTDFGLVNKGTGGNFLYNGGGAITTGTHSPSDGRGECQAILGITGERKCYNTRVTCQDPAAYNPGTLTLRFARPQGGLLAYGNVIPSLAGIETTPSAINLAAMDAGAAPLGQREVVNVRLSDHQHSDHLVDKYRLERPTGEATTETNGEFDPYERGTFWGKWLARNPYHSAYRCRVREGYVGDALIDMRVRNYIIDRIQGPAGGAVTIVAKDLFSIIEVRKAVAPRASQGELAADLTGSPGTFSVSPTGVGDLDETEGGYASITSGVAGHVAIGDEVIEVTRSGDTFTVVVRGALGTGAEDHEEEDLVQIVLRYSAAHFQDIIYDLLTNYSSVDPATIALSDWDGAGSEITTLYTGRIGEPTPVSDLIGELSEQAGVTFWHDVATDQIRLAALRPRVPTVTVDDDAWIIEGSLQTRRQDSRRVSQVWVYYGIKSPVAKLDDRRNYHSRVVIHDAEAEALYGSPGIREAFSRWIPQFGRTAALDTGNRLLAMFRDPPTEVEFALDASREGELDLAEFFNLQTAEIQDDTGAEKSTTMAVVEIERGENKIRVRAQGVAFFSGSGTGGGGGGEGEGERIIYIENDVFNLNLRTVHDSLYLPPVGGSPGETVRFIVLPGFTVGSTSTASPALRTGAWPAGVTLIVENRGRVQGKGGNGFSAGFPLTNPEAGGDALLVEYVLYIENAEGQLWGGGGGGGAEYFGGIGGGGGGGAGTAVGSGGHSWLAGPVDNGYAGDGTSEAGGLGKDAGSGEGADGGGPGLPGENPPHDFLWLDGGAAGKYINGNALVTWVSTGDRRGGVA
jgi:hypothetical protein